MQTVGDAVTVKLGGLVKDGKITPKVAEALTDLFVGAEGATLAASMKTVKDPTEIPNKVIAALSDNDPLQLGEKSGPQTHNDIVTLSRNPDNKNVLQEDADRRVKAAEAQRALISA